MKHARCLNVALSAAIVALLAACDSGSHSGDASTDDAAAEEASQCTAPADCAVGVNYRDSALCAQPFATTADLVESEPCITAPGEVPGASCLECTVTTESGRGGRLIPGRRWLVGCDSDGSCTATEEPCPAGDCPTDAACSTSLDCFLGYLCDPTATGTGACVSGCDTGFDCRNVEVCVREPPDAEFGRCVFSG